MSGRMSPLTPESAVVRELMKQQGLEAKHNSDHDLSDIYSTNLCSISIYLL